MLIYGVINSKWWREDEMHESTSGITVKSSYSQKNRQEMYLSTKSGVRNPSVLSGNLLPVKILNYVACFIYLSYNKECLTG